MPVLSFNLRVILGFVIILVLLAVSGVSSLWNLFGIDRSNTRVNDIAVPVVRQGNLVQIELLKLANLSALGFNAQQQEAFEPYQRQFAATGASFRAIYDELRSLSEQDAGMRELVVKVGAHYQDYEAAVNEMFEAKSNALEAKGQVDGQVTYLIGLLDNVASAITEVMFYEPPGEFADDMAVAAGSADQADSLFARMVPEIQSLQRSLDAEESQDIFSGIETSILNAMEFFGHAEDMFRPFDERGLIGDVHQAVDTLSAALVQEDNILHFKSVQLAEREQATVRFEQSIREVNLAVQGLDQLLLVADEQFARLQNELTRSVDFGFKSTLAILVVLYLIATQNFLSMRRAIRRKMDDLALLNQIGGTLSAARDQQTALQEVLQAFSDKTGVEQGSVYLFNKAQDLEAKAFLPPRMIPQDSKAITFTLGEGVIGHAAAAKQTIFVPDTSREKHYVSATASEKPRALICVPLLDKDMLIGVMNFSGAVGEVSFADSDYEFVASAANSLVTTIKNIRMVEVIEEHNRNLEKKVEERTAALKQKNDDIANMLQNMNQGLFTIDDNGVVHPEYAAYLETIMETTQIAQRHYADLLFQHAEASQDVIDQVTTSVESIVGEDIMMFEFNEHLLASELTLKLPGQADKLIELDWNPIADENDTVIKLMVTVRDVTALKALQAEADKQRQELMIIGEVLAIDADKFEEFLAGSQQFIARCRQIILQTPTKDADSLAEMFRNMHTVKGNARTYGLKKITETVHLIENSYDQLRKDEESVWDAEQLLAELALADDIVNLYSEVFYRKLGRGADTHVVKLPRERVHQLVANINHMNLNDIPGALRPFVQSTYSTLISADAKPMQEVIAGVLASVTSLAGELGKPAPHIDLDDAGLLIRNEVHGLLNNVFMHVLRNAMDHGIEKPADRIRAGKPEQGKIRLMTTVKDDMVSIAVQDDGKGVALTRIFEKAIENGLYATDAPRPPAAEIANLIFASGFSTAEQVTEVSGRGVGMDAVKSFLKSEGGSINVELEPGDELADFRAFATVLSLPTKFFIEPLGLALAS